MAKTVKQPASYNLEGLTDAEFRVVQIGLYFVYHQPLAVSKEYPFPVTEDEKDTAMALDKSLANAQ